MEIKSTILTPTQNPPFLLANEKEENNITKIAKRNLNPAAEAVSLAIAFQDGKNQVLIGKDRQARELLGNIDQLLQVSQDILSLPEDTSPDTKEKIATIANQLKNLNLIDDATTITTREQLLECKAQIPFQIDQARTKVQEHFMKIQNLMQDINSVNDTIKKLIAAFEQLNRTILQRTRQ